MFLFLFPRQSRKRIRTSASHYKANLKRQRRRIGKQREDDSDDEGAKVGKKREKEWKETAEKQEREREEGEAGRRAKYRGGCQCGGLMVGVPRLQAISLCYQAKWLCKYDNKSQWKSIWEEATVSHW